MTVLSNEIVQGAQAAEKTWGVPACIGLSQCILESQGFKLMPVGSNNGLGIQALSGLPSVAAPSFEYIHGVREPVVEHFAKFTSIADAFYEWGKLLATNPVYADAFAARDDWITFILRMAPHYATAPNYAAILIEIVKANNLNQYNLSIAAKGT